MSFNWRIRNIGLIYMVEIASGFVVVGVVVRMVVVGEVSSCKGK